MIRSNKNLTAPTVTAIAQEILDCRRIPSATYRIQFNSDFTFRDAQGIIPYLHDLGISDCYASPLLKPRVTSSHGYDITDHGELNPALGGEEAFEAFSADLRARQMGLIFDTVPNHMGIGDVTNVWWMDMLENGPSSIYASYFDIDWHPVKPELENQVLLPILGDQYGNILESGQLKLVYEDGAFFVYYYEHKLPIAPGTYSGILSYKLEDLVEHLGVDDENVLELQSILTAISYLPPRTETAIERIAERNREKEVIKRRIATLYDSSSDIREALDASVQAYNGTVGDPPSFNLLDQLIRDQAYRLAFWRVAAEEINYRRFFDINDLAAIRVELPEVFHATHHLIFRYLAEDKVTGLRVDHPDGLWDPPSYFRQLQESYVLYKVRAFLEQEHQEEEEHLAQEVAGWITEQFKRNKTAANPWPLYVVAEKILSEGESLPLDWAVAGTTGYDFLNVVNGTFVDGNNRRAFDRIYNNFSGNPVNFNNLVNSTKKMIMLVSLASETSELSHQLERIAERNRRYRDFTLNSLTFAIREVIAGLSVYRTYINGTDGVARWDQKYIEAAVKEAQKRNPRTAEAIFNFIRDTLTLRNVEDFAEEDQMRLLDFVMKFQQITGPVMAKGVEDTAFYLYNRLVSLNEVGGHPTHFGHTVNAFHKQNSDTCRRWPHALLTSSTHDTKRSEDVRARINVLSEIPEEWRTALTRWSRHNASKRTKAEGEAAPDRNDEYLLYQTLVGAWPNEISTPEEFADFRDRIVAYMQKATKEAKFHTSWVNPNEEYDAAVQNFVQRVLSDDRKSPFLKDIQTFQRRINFYGQFNALAQTLIKLTAPGVPDIYQGCELWDYSLVDPDNRRPVDYDLRRSLLADLKQRIEQSDSNLVPLVRELLDTSQDGRVKLYLIYRTLHYRRQHEQLFTDGDYQPLEANGDKQEHVVAFRRFFGEESFLVVTPRLFVRLTNGNEQMPLGKRTWTDTWISLEHDQPGQQYRNLFTGEQLTTSDYDGMPGLPLASICAHFPVALLERVR